MNKTSKSLETLRHSTEHVLTQAMINLYGKKLKMAMGPATDDGFYFDFDYPEKISEADFKKIETAMHKIIAQNLPFKKEVLSVEKARGLFKGNEYKQEWLDEIKEKKEPAVIFHTGDKFTDICTGPHLKSTGEIKVFKLLSVAGAYWRGSEKNKMLTRIYGTAFYSQKELKQYLQLLQEAKKRDHRKLGKELELFTFSDLVGKGLPLFTAKGATIWRQIERFVTDEEIKQGYQHVQTPSLAKTDLYRKSGHYPYYKDTMYPPMKVDEEELILRPMTCPHHFALYLSQPRSYRDLPIRYAEFASQYRYEKSGELTGLIRVRKFCLADSHIFVKKQQADKEINNVLNLIESIASVFGFKKGQDYRYRLSLGSRNDKQKYFDDPKEWQYGENLLKQVLEKRQAPFFEAQDEAAFYGPKIDIQMKNISGKEDTAFTVQYDFCLPQRFKLAYTNEKGQDEQPIVIHRSSVGAMERSIGFLIEHYAGAFPVWLAPVQISLIPISDKQLAYAQKVKQSLEEKNIRVELDDRPESMQAKIRDAEMQKIPYLLILGEKETKAKTVSVRQRSKGNLGTMSLTKFISQITKQVEEKTID